MNDSNTYVLDNLVDVKHLLHAGFWGGWEVLIDLFILVGLGDLDVCSVKFDFVNLK